MLLDIAEAARLDRSETEAVLHGSRYTEQVRNDEAEAARLGVRGVPFFVLNRKYAISGAQPVDVFRRALETVWEEEQQALPLRPLADGGGACTDGNCSIDESVR
ncbi:hypothetical protein GsuE55_30770 [Geobacillus subterraneus]|uniref:DSBA-like thioredoxin domain-containing protein n=1 Tax=Geobacillus subterraneus TaxID=129338 RepID=A0A679FZI2_9BACL|nr:hypothetical protein GsuE55_30770 [Geobacillus subterraneus]